MEPTEIESEKFTGPVVVALVFTGAATIFAITQMVKSYVAAEKADVKYYEDLERQLDLDIEKIHNDPKYDI